MNCLYNLSFTVVMKGDRIRGQCIGLAVVTVKGKENSELYSGLEKKTTNS
jgi:hypothetical protein